MSRTLRRSRRHPMKDVRDGEAYRCSDRQCGYCAAGRQFTFRRDSLAARLALAEAVAA